TNVTLSSSPTQIVKQRQNAAEALSRGAEISAQGHWRNWRGEASYLYASSNYTNGKRIPEVLHHQGSAQLSYDKGGTLLSAAAGNKPTAGPTPRAVAERHS